jgi:hypothetical protein
MLILTVPGRDLYDEAKEEFIKQEPFTLELEHSLVSLSKWESKFRKPFLGSNEKTQLEILGYIESMIIDPVYPDDAVRRLSAKNMEDIKDYIESSETATTFGEMPKKNVRGEVVTSELIYYWLVVFNIPFEVERWHLNRLFSLIRICNIKNQKPTKTSKNDTARKYRELNAQRKAQLNTSG